MAPLLSARREEICPEAPSTSPTAMRAFGSNGTLTLDAEQNLTAKDAMVAFRAEPSLAPMNFRALTLLATVLPSSVGMVTCPRRVR